MRVLRGPYSSWDPGADALAVTVGVYDGIHLGHLAVFEALRAPDDGLPIGVVTFAQHPATLLAPERVPPQLTSVDQRLEAMEAAGVDVVGLLDFDEELQSMSAEAFVEDVLVGAMAASLIVVGTDFRFGKGRVGDVMLLQQMGLRLGFATGALNLRAMVGEVVSSSRIRALVLAGDVASAATLLGREFALRGPVVAGDARGRTIGIPTANVAVDAAMALPARGVYAARVGIDGTRHDGVVNVGVRPTFGGDHVVVEVHILDFDDDLYDTVIDVAFVDRIRDEQRFEGIDDLVAQIHRDITRTRELLA